MAWEKSPTIFGPKNMDNISFKIDKFLEHAFVFGFCDSSVEQEQWKRTRFKVETIEILG
jgi:hypothetical protein